MNAAGLAMECDLKVVPRLELGVLVPA